MATNFFVSPFSASLAYSKFDITYASNGIDFLYATQDSVGQTPEGYFRYNVTASSSRDDLTTLYFSQTGNVASVQCGSIIVVEGTFSNYTGMALGGGSGYCNYVVAGYNDTHGAGGTISMYNPAWTSGFLFTPSYSTTIDTNQRIIEAKFGDGYSQRQRAGLNTNVFTWSLAFNERSDKEAKAMLNFIEDKGGVEPVELNIPINKFLNNPHLRYLLRDPKMNTAYYNLNNISVVAVQSFDVV